MRVPVDALHVQHDLPVVEQQRVALDDILRQLLVGGADLGERAGLRIERGVEREATAPPRA